MEASVSVVERGEALVTGYLQQLGIEYRQGEGVITAPAGSTVIYMSVREFRGSAVVHLVAPLLEGVEPNSDCLGELASLNHQVLFARFAYDERNQRLTVEYDLFGDTLDEEELSIALQAVGHIADEWDERLQARFGGRRPLVDGSASAG